MQTDRKNHTKAGQWLQVWVLKDVQKAALRHHFSKIRIADGKLQVNKWAQTGTTYEQLKWYWLKPSHKNDSPGNLVADQSEK
jgi:hypothetical protein